MDTADRIGLFPYAGWLAGHDLLASLLLALALTPLAMIVIAPVLESRWLPLRPSKQYVSFFPGDIFLGSMTAGLLTLAQKLPSQERWYNSTLWHGAVQVLTIVVAIVLTAGERKAASYGKRAMKSPTKRYHNYLLYAGYGYIIIVTLTAVLFGSSWSWGLAGWLLLCLVPGLIWLRLVVIDNSLGSEASRLKAASAHVEDWEPIWYGWRRLLQPLKSWRNRRA